MGRLGYLFNCPTMYRCKIGLSVLLQVIKLHAGRNRNETLACVAIASKGKEKWYGK